MSFRSKKKKGKAVEQAEISSAQGETPSNEVQSESGLGSVAERIDPELGSIEVQPAEIIEQGENPSKALYEEITNEPAEEPVGSGRKADVETLEDTESTIPATATEPVSPEPQADMGSYIRSLMVTQSPLDRVLLFACDEFLGELLTQPSSNRRVKLGSEDIRLAARSLGWKADEESASCFDDRQVLLSEFYLDPLRESQKRQTNLSVYLGNTWKSGTGKSNEQSHKPSNTITPLSSLPVGIRELLLHIQLAYSQEPSEVSASALSKEQVIEAVKSSTKLGLVYPYVIRYCVRRIRESLRVSGISDLLNLLNGIILNPSFEFNSASDFELLFNCLINIVIDVNLLRDSKDLSEEKSLGTKIEAIKVLSLLLSMKVGKYHSAELVASVTDKMFGPFLSQASNLKEIDDLGIMSSIAAVIVATKELSSQFSNRHNAIDILSGLKSLLKSPKLQSKFPVVMQEIKSQIEMFF